MISCQSASPLFPASRRGRGRTKVSCRKMENNRLTAKTENLSSRVKPKVKIHSGKALKEVES